MGRILVCNHLISKLLLQEGNIFTCSDQRNKCGDCGFLVGFVGFGGISGVYKVTLFCLKKPKYSVGWGWKGRTWGKDGVASVLHAASTEFTSISVDAIKPRRGRLPKRMFLSSKVCQSTPNLWLLRRRTTEMAQLINNPIPEASATTLQETHEFN